MSPDSEAALAEAVAAATGPLAVRGGGTRAGLGQPVAGTPIETGALTGVTLYEPGALTLVAKAGTPLSEIEATLATENQRLAFEPMDHRALFATNGAPTIGGVVSGNVSGPRRIQTGACRDHMLGVRFVDGAGQIVKNGGRVMKNVTGYDLVKLLTGSHGTLGILTEVSLKVLPATETVATVMLSGLSDQDAVAALSDAVTSPFDVSGAAHLPVGPDGTPVTLIRIEGFETSVTERASKLTDRLARHGADIAVEREAAANADLWRSVRDALSLAGRPGDVWRVSVKPSDGPAVVAATKPIGHAFDWAGGLVWLLLPEGQDVRGALTHLEGHATLIRASDDTKARLGVFHPEPAPLAAIAQGLKARFDPRGVLNPGRMG